MTTLARLADVLPLDNAPYPPPAPSAVDGPLREVLGQGRLTAAVEHWDAAATDRLLDQLLAHPWLGPRLAGRVWARMGQTLTGDSRP